MIEELLREKSLPAGLYASAGDLIAAQSSGGRQVGLTQVGSSQVRPAQNDFTKIGAAQIGRYEHGLRQISRRAVVGRIEPGAAEDGFPHLRLHQVGTPQINMAKNGRFEMYAAQVGAAQEAQQQAQLQADIDRFMFEQMRPQQKLAEYMTSVAGGTVGSQQVQPVYRNPALGFLSGGLAGGQLAGTLKSAGALGGMTSPFLMASLMRVLKPSMLRTPTFDIFL